MTKKFSLEHWKNPRQTIACVYADNDMAYVTHGIKCAWIILELINEKPSELKSKTILDYGCGTGKNVRALHYYFRKAHGYDPVKECINVGHHEIRDINKPVPKFPKKKPLLQDNLFLTSNINDVINTRYDYIICQDVIQHLNEKHMKVVVENICQMLDAGGKAYINGPKDAMSFVTSILNKDIDHSFNPTFSDYIQISK